MDVIPGIDLMGGRCVCAFHLPFMLQDEQVSHNAVKIARLWAQRGARRFYIADLDGARMGFPQNLSVVEEIVKETGVPVDLGGGIRSVDTALRVLDAGIDRVVVGTSAALDQSLAKDIFGTIGKRAVLSVASLNGYVAVRDWQARTDERAEEFAKRMCDLGAQRIVFTDVSRKGMHSGVNITQLKRLAQKLHVPIIASGGVSSIDDIKEIKAIEHFGIEGVVVVTAIYSGEVDLTEAIEIAKT
jgi:phosphoribosylformimino-5-aminoimidazole carboxamide ribotide isomerase